MNCEHEFVGYEEGVQCSKCGAGAWQAKEKPPEVPDNCICTREARHCPMHPPVDWSTCDELTRHMQATGEYEPAEVPAPDEDVVDLYQVLAICKKADDDSATPEWIADEVSKLRRYVRAREGGR